MSQTRKNNITMALFGLLTTFLMFWGAQTSACAEHIQTLYDRVERLEDIATASRIQKKELELKISLLQKSLSDCTLSHSIKE